MNNEYRLCLFMSYVCTCFWSCDFSTWHGWVSPLKKLALKRKILNRLWMTVNNQLNNIYPDLLFSGALVGYDTTCINVS